VFIWYINYYIITHVSHWIDRLYNLQAPPIRRRSPYIFVAYCSQSYMRIATLMWTRFSVCFWPIHKDDLRSAPSPSQVQGPAIKAVWQSCVFTLAEYIEEFVNKNWYSMFEFRLWYSKQIPSKFRKLFAKYRMFRT